jgi:DNA-binding SARP family transcriptional activator
MAKAGTPCHAAAAQETMSHVGPAAGIQASVNDSVCRGDASGLVRQRLTSQLLDPTAYVVGRIVAPAGCGKTRLLTHVAVAYQGPVAWCGTPDPVPRSEQALAEWLWDGLVPALGMPGRPPTGIDGVLEALAGPGPAAMVVIDDVHLLEGSDAELALADLIRRLPARIRLLMASRVNLALDLSRLRVSGQLVEIGPDDLRFRAWEVEELFRDVYREPMIPEDVATLALRTAGWAAYLQLFHLATARKPQAEKRRVLASLANRVRLVQEYLTRHVLSELSPDLQDFLIRTSVLRRPTVALCDELLGWDGGSRELLDELERRELFTERIGDDGYRYHTVLLSYLEARLVETVGAAAARDEHRRAALLLEQEGFSEDAAAAFAKAEDWEGLARTLGHPDESGNSLAGAWLEALPPTVVETDALLLMARARRALASGSLADAAATMRAAEAVAASSAVAERCRWERDRIGAWMSSTPSNGADWMSVLRGATQRQPRQAQRAAAVLGGVSGRFSEGASAFLAGDMLSAWRILRSVAIRPDGLPALTAAARLLATVAGSLCGLVPSEGELERLREEVEEAGIPWLDRMAAVAVGLFGPVADDALDNLADACQREGDRWGEALVGLLGGVSGLWRGSAGIAYLERASRILEELGAGVLVALSHGYLALCAHATGDRELAIKAARQSRALASLLEVPGPAGLAALALARVLGDDAELVRARQLLEPLGTWEWHEHLAIGGGDAAVERGPESGILDAGPGTGPVQQHTALPGDTPSGALVGGRPPSSAHPPVRLRCFGGFSLETDGRAVDDSAAKPKERALLHLLAMRAGERVHREELIEALWPEAEPDAGLHRLQVAISALRRLMGAGVENASSLLGRHGNAYSLAVPDDSDCDLWRFSAHLRRAAASRNISVVDEAEALEASLADYGGPLLPDDGPAEWVVGRRSMFQDAAADASARLASLRLERGEHRAAAESARVGLSLDRFRDDLWNLLIDATDRCGYHAEAGQARRAYAAVLDELGV